MQKIAELKLEADGNKGLRKISKTPCKRVGLQMGLQSEEGPSGSFFD